MKWLNSDLSKFFGLYAVCIITTYFLPNFINQLFFLLLLLLFYRSKEDYFWFAFIFFLVDPPGGFFPVDDLNYGIPMYNFIPGGLRLIYFQELFIFVAFLKALKNGTKYKFYFTRALILLLLYFIILFIISFFLGFSIMKIFAAIRNAFPWTLIISISVLISTHEEWIKFFRLIFNMLIVSAILQVLYIVLNQPPANIIGTNFVPSLDFSGTISESPSSEILRPISSPFVALIALMGSMIYLLFKGNVFNRFFLILILGFSTFSIIITGTRGWIIAYFVMILIFLFLMGISAKRFMQLGFVILIFLTSLLFLPTVRNQIINSLYRFETLKSFTKGDFTAQGTLSRVTEYSPHVMAKFYESPVFGWGFSDEYTKYSNAHVGNQTLLLSVGVVGFLLFFYFWISLCRMPIMLREKLSIGNPFRKSLLSIPIIFIGLFIIHSTSGLQFYYLISYQNIGFNQTLFYSIANFYVIAALNSDLKNTQKQ